MHPVDPSAAGASPNRWEVAAWSAIAVAALAIAGVFAALLAISRLPGIEAVFPWPVGFFHKSLVVHVVFSFVIWLLAVFGAWTALSEDDSPTLSGRLAVIAMMVAFPLLFVPAFLDRGEATLNNYVPAIIDPVYYAGLIAVAAAVVLAAIRPLAGWLRGPTRHTALGTATAASALIAVLAVASFAIAAALLQGEPVSYSFNEELFWGGGHLLQALNTLLLVTVWTRLAGAEASPPVRRALLVASLWLLLVAAAGPVFYALFEPFSTTQTRAFTALQYLLGPPALVVAAALLHNRGLAAPRRDAGDMALLLSMLVFAVGGAFGLFVDGADTRTPAHYHGVIGGVTTAFMGLFYGVILPALERAEVSPRLVRLQLSCYAFGQLAACIGLFIAGGYGAPRKVAGEAQGLDALGAMIGMGLNGLGMLFAVAGGALFVWLVGTALLRSPGQRAGRLDLSRPAAGQET